MRGLGAHIKGTNGTSQGCKRKGAVCAYLETRHIDIEEFLELRKNTGDDRRARQLGVEEPFPGAQANLRKEKNFFETHVTEYQSSELRWQVLRGRATVRRLWLCVV